MKECLASRFYFTALPRTVLSNPFAWTYVVKRTNANEHSSRNLRSRTSFSRDRHRHEGLNGLDHVESLVSAFQRRKLHVRTGLSERKARRNE